MVGGKQWHVKTKVLVIDPAFSETVGTWSSLFICVDCLDLSASDSSGCQYGVVDVML